jgi:predicted amidohydrolase YtcJ
MKSTFNTLVLGCLLGGAVLKAQTAATLQNIPPEILAYADIVLYGGKVLTVDERFSVAEGVAIRGDRILAVGDTQRVLSMAGPRTAKVDLKGKTVIPGLIDTHYHLGDYSLRYMLIEGPGIQWEGKPEGLGLTWTDTEMALRDIRRAVAKAAPGETVSFPIRNEDAILSALTMERLDAVSPNNPVLLLSAAQLGTVGANSKAISDATIPAGTPGLPSNGGVRVTGRAVEYLKLKVSPESQLHWQEKTMKLMNRWGLTLVTTRITPEQFNAVRELWLRDRLTIRWRVAFPGPVNFQRTGNVSDIGDNWLRISGAPGGAMPGAAETLGHWTTHRPLAAVESASDEEGASADPAESWSRRRPELLDAFRYGWSVPNTHIKGNVAVREFLNTVEAARANPAAISSNQRITMDHMIEVDDADIQRIKKLGVIPSSMMRIVFSDDYSYEGSSHYEKVFGADYVSRMLPLKRYLDLGITPTIEADIGDERGRPLWTIEKAVCRCVDGSSRVWAPDQRVSRQDALRMKTIWSATYTGDEKELGSLEPGKLADLLVLDGDYLSVPEHEISELKILLTIVGGETGFADASLGLSQ